ncbi:unnamed protein product [Spirodela intermedia]|uniref:Uncharacterized protein n=1 Tax=Spirodela intermedia TaxID=51605 RepID=A0ABN7E924_SPIIN|nr:unnamed protein product [Spirodela intermedia]
MATFHLGTCATSTCEQRINSKKAHMKVENQEEALHRIWYALRRWRLVSRWIVLFPTTACSSISRR